MAISGSGTSSDPYIVHDWSELLEAFDGVSGNYVELANDIEAPAEAVTVNGDKTISLDGKGFAINNLHHSGSESAAISMRYASPSYTGGHRYLKNIKFTNIYITDGYCIWAMAGGSDHRRFYIENVSFSGRVDSGTLIRGSQSSMYGPWTDIKRIAANIETGIGNVCISSYEYEDKPSISNGNIRVKYLNCSPQSALSSWDWSNTLFDITTGTEASEVNLGRNLSNCCVIGKGGVTFTSGSGSVVVENTLSLPDPAPSNTYSLSTTDIKDAQTLHDDYGFPIGVD